MRVILQGELETQMAEKAVLEQSSHRWYARPVLFVADVNRALRFYMDMLGFEKIWHEGDGAGKVCQVNRAQCEIILCEDATRRDKGRLFVELTFDGLAALSREIVERPVTSEKSWWGYDVIKIVDPDGNELLFPVASGQKLNIINASSTPSGVTRRGVSKSIAPRVRWNPGVNRDTGSDP